MPRIRQLTEKYAKDDRKAAEKNFWEEIKRCRNFYDIYSDNELGIRLNITGHTISNNRTGQNKMSVDTVQRLIDFLKPDIKVVLLFLGYSEKDINAFILERVNR